VCCCTNLSSVSWQAECRIAAGCHYQLPLYLCFGQVRYIGVSNETSWGVCQFHAAAKAHGLPKVQTIQNSYSLLYRGAFETDLAETCAPHNANVSLLVGLYPL
jgi:Aldo/keto reductase family